MWLELKPGCLHFCSQLSSLALRSQSLFCDGASSMSLERCRLVQHTTDLRQLGGHHPPLLLSGGFFAPNSFFFSRKSWWDVPGSTWVCYDAMRFRKLVSFNQSHTKVRLTLSAAPARNQPHKHQIAISETLPCTPVWTALKIAALLLGNTMYRFEQEIYCLLAQNLTSPHPLLAVSL